MVFSTTWVSGALLEPGELRDRLRRCLLDAKRFFDTTAAPELLALLLGHRQACRSLLEPAARLHHIGFVVPPGAEETIGALAAEAGFTQGHTAVSSSLLARELGQLAGKPRVPTTVFKQYGMTASGQRVAVEAFLTNEDERLVRTWIEKGVGSHVAFELSDASVFAEVRRLFPAKGLAMPPFMDDSPRFSRKEGVTFMYFELGLRSTPLRLEILGRGDLSGLGRRPDPSSMWAFDSARAAGASRSKLDPPRRGSSLSC
jgi:hypothetical protein